MSKPRHSTKTPPALLVIGIHREELAFGRAVADGLESSEVTVLAISEGISGKRPLEGQRFRYETLHRALYLQLLPHMLGSHRLLIDLHTGFDPLGPSADLFCADAALRTRLEVAISNNILMNAQSIRVIPVGADTAIPHAQTVIPRQIWANPAFQYVGMEIYLPEMAEAQSGAQKFARDLVSIVAHCATENHYLTVTSAST